MRLPFHDSIAVVPNLFPDPGPHIRLDRKIVPAIRRYKVADHVAEVENNQCDPYDFVQRRGHIESDDRPFHIRVVHAHACRDEQQETDTIRRAESGIIFRYLVYLNWYITASIALLSNTEQKLDMRNNWKLGIGKYFIHTNQSHWGGRIGANRNIERFSSETPDRNSWEIYLGSELDLFDIGDLSLYTNILVYRSVTEAGRWRTDGSFDAKYDLPLDFYIKAGISFNYDNQPAEGASDWDYVIQTGFGWEW